MKWRHLNHLFLLGESGNRFLLESVLESTLEPNRVYVLHPRLAYAMHCLKIPTDKSLQHTMKRLQE